MNKFIIPTVRKLLEPNYRFMSRAFQKDVESDPAKPKFVSKKAKEHEERITLIGFDNSVSIMELEKAQSLSERRQMKLVKIEDINAKTRRPVYKLMSNTEYYKEELERRQEKKEERQSLKKGDKLVTISSKIAEHDLMTKVKQTLKWLQKQHEVKIVITGDKDDELKASERIHDAFETNIKLKGKIVQKRNKSNSLRFQIIPETPSTTELETQNTISSSDSKKTKATDEKGPL